MFNIKKTLTASLIGVVAISSLSGCVVSNDPNVNAAVTAGVVGTAASLLFYSISDGYYYDHDYNRMPRNYRPHHNAQITRVYDIHEYRRANTIGSRYNNNTVIHKTTVVNQPAKVVRTRKNMPHVINDGRYNVGYKHGGPMIRR